MNEALERRVAELAREYAAKRSVRCAVVFGSAAAGKLTEVSDIDLLLVVEGSGIEVTHELLDGRVVEVTVVGEGEFRDMLKRGNPFIVNALLNGKPILGADYCAEAIKTIDPKAVRAWAAEYYGRGLEYIESGDRGDLVSAVVLLLNAYMLAKGELALSYSVEKLTKRVRQKELRALASEVLASADVERAKRIAEIVRLEIGERA